MQLSQEVLQRRVFNQQVYDLHSTEFMLSQTGQFIDPFKNVVDVGAAVGMYTTYWAQRCARVFSFEAVPAVYEQLCKVKDRFENVNTYNLAVSDYEGSATFYVDDKRLSNSSFRDLVGGKPIVVNVTCLDMMDIPDIGFIKIDVEGHELDVLKGAEEVLANDRPVCMIEVYPEFNNGAVDDTFKFMLDRKYDIFYNVRGEGLQKCDSLERAIEVAHDPVLIRQHDGDFLFVPKERNFDHTA